MSYTVAHRKLRSAMPVIIAKGGAIERSAIGEVLSARERRKLFYSWTGCRM